MEIHGQQQPPAKKKPAARKKPSSGRASSPRSPREAVDAVHTCTLSHALPRLHTRPCASFSPQS